MNPLYYAAIACVGLSVMIYLTLSYQRKIAARKKQDECARRINDIKASFKTTLDMFLMQRVIRPCHVDQIYAVVNNFFACHAINDRNTKALERLANRITITIVKEMNLSKTQEDTDWVKKKLLNFAVRLPTETPSLRQKLLPEQPEKPVARTDHHQVHLYPTQPTQYGLDASLRCLTGSVAPGSPQFGRVAWIISSFPSSIQSHVNVLATSGSQRINVGQCFSFAILEIARERARHVRVSKNKRRATL